MNKTPATTTPRLAVRFGNSKQVVAVASFEEASKAWERLRDENEISGRESHKVTVIDLDTGKTVAHISDNGRVWDGPPGRRNGSKEIKIGNIKTVAEHEAENWKDFH